MANEKDVVQETMDVENMSIHEKLVMIQNELHAPKSQYNKFGQYYYRSCEDILEAVKPLLMKYKTTMTVCDEIVFIDGRFYVKAVATLMDFKGNSVSNTAYARESESRKGSDEAQVTGATSSYARKYSLNGLFLIDDNKDSDSNEKKTEDDARKKKVDSQKSNEEKNQEMIDDANNAPITDKEKAILTSMVEKKGYTVEQIFPKGLDGMTGAQYMTAVKKLETVKPKA